MSESCLNMILQTPQKWYIVGYIRLFGGHIGLFSLIFNSRTHAHKNQIGNNYFEKCDVCVAYWHCNSLQHTVDHCNSCDEKSDVWVAYRNPLQNTVTHCNAPQHTATQHDTLQQLWRKIWCMCGLLQHTATHCNSLQHTATHCNTL